VLPTYYLNMTKQSSNFDEVGEVEKPVFTAKVIATNKLKKRNNTVGNNKHHRRQVSTQSHEQS
jgi:hypothetical protein